MSKRFRLLRSSGVFEERDLLEPRYERQAFPSIEFSHKPAGGSSSHWVTVVIGKNGVGKSRLLAGIADMFEALDRAKDHIRSEDPIVAGVTYEIDGRVCKIDSEPSGRLLAKIDDQRCELAQLPVPARVIALTTTPFDKFRIPRSLLRVPGRVNPNPEPERYTYLGLRDRTGRASTTASIFRALEGLFEASRSEAERRMRIAEVFKFLGYKPYVEARYELPPSSIQRLERIAHGEPLNDILEHDRSNSLRSALGRILERGPDVPGELQRIASETLHRARRQRYFSLRADFENYSADEQFFREVQLLRRLELVRMRAVEVERFNDGAKIDLKQASSGELGIVTSFIGLASVIEDGCLIFIDEPEISLHPEWQTRYIELLLKTFENFHGCHFVLATHSPLILSDISPENSNVVSLDPERRDAERGGDFAGQSSDHLLVTAFQVPGKNNLYLKQEIIKALRLAADGKAASVKFTKIVKDLAVLLPKMEEDSPVTRLIRELIAVNNENNNSK